MNAILTVTVPRTSTKLVALDELKAELQITATDSDDYLSGLLDRVSGTIEQYCRRVFSQETVQETIRLPCNGAESLLLKRFPVIEVSAVTVDGTALTAAMFETELASGTLYRLSEDSQIRWFGKVVVTYSTGYAAIPAPVQQAVFELVKLGQAARARDPSLRSENILEGLYSYQLFVPTDMVGGLPPNVAAQLDHYVVPFVG